MKSYMKSTTKKEIGGQEIEPMMTNAKDRHSAMMTAAQ